jgi:hypothetical protein
MTPIFSFNSKVGNVFEFNYTLQGVQPQFDIEITPPANGIITISRYQSNNVQSPFNLTIPNLISGIYRFRMRGVCGLNSNSPTSLWTDYVDVNASVINCIPPSGILLFNEISIQLISYLNGCLNFSIINGLISGIQVESSIDNGSTWVNNTGSSVSPRCGFQITTPTLFRLRSSDDSNIISNTLQATPQILSTHSFFYISNWYEGDTIHNPLVNSWVDYKDEYGTTQRYQLGGIESGCQEIIASSIIHVNGGQTCQSSTVEQISIIQGSCSGYVVMKVIPNGTVNIEIEGTFASNASYLDSLSLPNIVDCLKIYANFTDTISEETTYTFGIDAYKSGSNPFVSEILLSVRDQNTGTLITSGGYSRTHTSTMC